jgi:hypothetical protein
VTSGSHNVGTNVGQISVAHFVNKIVGFSIHNIIMYICGTKIYIIMQCIQQGIQPSQRHASTYNPMTPKWTAKKKTVHISRAKKHTQ